MTRPTRNLAPGLIAREGRNCWRRTTAERVAFLVDAAAYYDAFAAAAERAEHSLIIIGWDLHSQTFLPSRNSTLRDFLNDMVARRPRLHVYVLDWDFAMIYALEREMLPAVQFGWRTPARVQFALDDSHPLGASHHQKLVVVDDAVAFAGGLDLTINRWDTPTHRVDDPQRTAPDGTPYGPFHDVQIAVDGDTAAAIGRLARERWLHATGHRIRRARRSRADPWPASLRPDVRHASVALARTAPSFRGTQEVREVERLYLDAIAAARRCIYIENQYVTATCIADALARRLREPAAPEVVVVTGRSCSGWLEECTMGALRQRWLRQLRAADRSDRLRVYSPVVPSASGHQPVNVHSKVLIVDDCLARIGSANISNRSMRLDTECDLAVESGGAPRVARAITRFRNRLLAEHLGTTPKRLQERLRECGSLIATIESLRTSARTLEPLPSDREPQEDAIAAAETVADPEGPIEPQAVARVLLPREAHERPRQTILRWAVPLVLPLLLAAAWQWTPLREWLNEATLQRYLERFAVQPFAILWVLGVYVVAGLLVVPLSVLIVATVFAYGGARGIPYALSGTLASALVTFAIGRAFAGLGFERLIGSRFAGLRRRLQRCSITAMTLIRLLPIAPFSVVNVLAGAAEVPLRSYAIGTLLGVTPGIVALGLMTAGLTGKGATAALSAGFGLLLLTALVFGGRWLRGHQRPGIRRGEVDAETAGSPLPSRRFLQGNA